jgi:hypothetical protein
LFELAPKAIIINITFQTIIHWWSASNEVVLT